MPVFASPTSTVSGDTQWSYWCNNATSTTSTSTSVWDQWFVNSTGTRNGIASTATGSCDVVWMSWTNTETDQTWTAWTNAATGQISAGSGNSIVIRNAQVRHDPWAKWWEMQPAKQPHQARNALERVHLQLQERARAKARKAHERRVQEEEKRLAEQRAAEEQRRREHRRAMEEERRANELAVQRAEQLLQSLLSYEQRQQLQRDAAFVVHGRHNRYRIRRGRVANIDVVDRDGRIRHRLCAHPIMMVPNADTMVAQKLWLESQEDEFLRIANIHNYDIPRDPVLPPLLPAPVAPVAVAVH